MAYFNHYSITPGLGLRESIDLILANDCVTGDGIEKLSNYHEVESWGFKSLVPAYTTWRMASYSSNGDTWKLAPHVTSSDLAEIIEAMASLDEYVLLNESRYSDLVCEETEKQLTSMAKEYGVDPEVFVGIARDNDVYGETENGEVYVSLHDEKLEAILDETKRVSQTEHAHYYGGEFHSPKHCPKCQEFPELIGARASEWSN